MTVFERIDQKRKERGIRKREICKACGINETAYTAWQNGKYESWRQYLPEIANVLNTTVEYLTTGAEPQENAILTAYEAAEEHVRKAIRILLKIEG